MPEALIIFCSFIVRLPARTLLALIWLYQRTLSPTLPVLLGPGWGCRFYPSCSRYAAEAVRSHGALSGAWLALRRLAKCQPLHPGGFDPVPARATRTAGPICQRIVAQKHTPPFGHPSQEGTQSQEGPQPRTPDASVSGSPVARNGAPRPSVLRATHA